MCVSNTESSVRDWQDMSTQGGDTVQRQQRAKEEKTQSHDQRHGSLSDKRRSMIPLCSLQSDRVCRTSRATEVCREGWQSRGVCQSPGCRHGPPCPTRPSGAVVNRPVIYSSDPYLALT